MARVIEFYVPRGFKPMAQWAPADQRGKIVEFPQPLSEEVRLSCSGAKGDVRGSQGGDAEC
jgi:hypothetical protein